MRAFSASFTVALQVDQAALQTEQAYAHTDNTWRRSAANLNI